MTALDEGDTCPHDGCGGRLEYPPAENCTCHINPPCAACTSVLLTCNLCFDEFGEPA